MLADITNGDTGKLMGYFESDDVNSSDNKYARQLNDFAVTFAKAFNEAIKLSGVVLTKMDGTSKGGIVLAIKEEQSKKDTKS